LPPRDGTALENDPISDIAVLRLASPATLSPQYDLDNETPSDGFSFRSFGFPTPKGRPVQGIFAGSIAGGWRSVVAERSFGWFISEGHSGCPTFNPHTNRVLGMSVSRDADTTTRTAFLIPASLLECAWPWLAKPYRGLRSFEESHAKYYFGREDSVSTVVERLKKRPFIVVLGRSGSGKSSLVRAGLIPELRRSSESIQIVTVRPASRQNILSEISLKRFRTVKLKRITLSSKRPTSRPKKKIANDISNDPLALSSRLKRWIHHHRAPHTIVLFVDQLEELFAREISENEKRVFITSIIAASKIRMHDCSVAVVSTLRVDYLGIALSFPPLADAMRDSHFASGCYFR
jgi:Novel STAND NTPase 1